MIATSFKAILACGVLAAGLAACDDTDDNIVPPPNGGEGSGSGSGSGSGTTTPTEHLQVSELVTSAQDAQLINPWGIVPAEGVFWIADNATGRVSVYDGTGRPSAEYPTGHLAPGVGITGLTRNADASAFIVPTCHSAAEFIFANTNGTLIATNDDTSVHGVKVVDRAFAGAMYFGVTRIDSATGPMLLAADFANARIDMFDSSFKLQPATSAFVDPEMPANYGPFNVIAADNVVYVTYAQIDAPGEEAHGPGLGRVTLFDTSGNVIGRLVSDKFNAPWGVTVDNGTRSIVIGNFGDGTMERFDLNTHASLGQLMDASGALIMRDGLWGITMGTSDTGNPNSIYFVQGNQNETAGIYGRIDRVADTLQ